MIIIVSAIIPPDHTGAGKRMYGFFEYLSNQGEDVLLLTYTKRKGRNIKRLRRINFNRGLRKIDQLINFVFSFIQLMLINKKFKSKTDKKTVWLTTVGSITFASVLFFRLKGYKIITQNTLVGSDDPAHKYNGDILGVKYRLKRMQYKYSDVITSISPKLLQISKKFHENCIMIPNPVDIKHFSSAVKSAPNKELINVLFVGRIAKRKGADIVFKTIAQIQKKYKNFEFYFVGPMGDINLHSYKLDNWDNVHMLDYQSDVCHWMSKCDIFFFPSRMEGFGTVFIEAMASGLPVIGKRIEGITDYIFDEKYSSILDSEDVDLYADELIRISTDSEYFEKLRSLGLSLVKRFDKKEIYRQYLQII